MTVDVEDWFHILDTPATPKISEWTSLPSRVVANTHRLLDIFEAYEARSTFFFLGWIAEKFPQLVRDCLGSGHEIGSHGYAHELLYRMTETQFRADALRSRQVIEQAVGLAVAGYRATGFSVSNKTPWFYPVLAELGYGYDSSVFPASHGHGGQLGAEPLPHSVSTLSGSITEVPISVAPWFGRPVCFFGGGYFRLFPYRVIARMTRKLLAAGQPVVFYLHPREIDPDHPRLKISRWRSFKSYVNISRTESKLRRLLSEFEFVSMEQYIRESRPTVTRQR